MYKIQNKKTQKEIIKYQYILIFIFIFASLFGLAKNSQAATLYMGPNEAYTNLQTAMAVMQGGDTLIIRDGYYTNSIITNPPSGTESAYTTIRAENMGAVTLDDNFANTGGYPGAVLKIGTDYIKIEGINFKNGDESVAQFTGNHIEIRNCSFSNASPAAAIVSINPPGKYILIEDSWIYGSGCNGIILFGGIRYDCSTVTTGYNTIRRVAIRTDRSTYEGGCHGVVIYGAEHNILENILVFDTNAAEVASTGNYRTGIRSREGYCSEGNSIFGSVILNLPTDMTNLGYEGYQLAVANCDDCVAWEVGGSGFVQDRWNEGYHLDHITSGANGKEAVELNNWVPTNSLINPTLEYILDPPGADGAKIINRYENGVLTQQALWPWPNENSIRKDFCSEENLTATGRIGENVPKWCTTNKTLTEYIWEYLGNPCPADVCNYSVIEAIPASPSGLIIN